MAPTSPTAPSRPAPAASPVIGVTCDLDERGYFSRRAYADAVLRAGGAPLLLAPPLGASPADLPRIVEAHLRAVDGVLFTGGDDPRTEPFGAPTHPAATLVREERQAYESALLRTLDGDAHRATPVLGVCLGMQMMSLHAGGALDQHLPDTRPDADRHRGGAMHEIRPIVPHAVIRDRAAAPSFHHQAVSNAGRLRAVALSDDGLIEAVDDPARPFYLGVQWHPEKAPDPAAPLADDLFIALVEKARAAHEARKNAR